MVTKMQLLFQKHHTLSIGSKKTPLFYNILLDREKGPLCNHKKKQGISIFLVSSSEKAMATHSSTLAWKIPGAWRATVHGVTRSWTQLKRLSSSSSILISTGLNNRLEFKISFSLESVLITVLHFPWLQLLLVVITTVFY